VAQPEQKATHLFKYDLLPQHFDQAINGSGTITHRPEMSSAELATTSSTGDSAQIATRIFFRYDPGREIEASMAMVIGSPVSGILKEWGLFSSDDGLS